MPHIRTIRALSLAVAFAGALSSPHAQADGGNLLPRSMPPAYSLECAACHTAYPPGMLPARSWQRIMGALDKHFGSDASLDAATLQQVGAWLQAHAGSYKRVAQEPPQDRITLSPWFARKHRKIDPTVWKHASIKSAAHCAACHTAADQGNYDDDTVRLPAALDALNRRGKND